MEELPIPGTFADKVQMLDAALTRKNAQTVAMTWRNQKSHHAPELWPESGAYYLSDGGYSRICCSEETGLFLTSNSRNEVKEGWQYCKELIADVEDEIKKALVQWEALRQRCSEKTIQKLDEARERGT